MVQGIREAMTEGRGFPPAGLGGFDAPRKVLGGFFEGFANAGRAPNPRLEGFARGIILKGFSKRLS